jgi:hypothetical protein
MDYKGNKDINIFNLRVLRIGRRRPKSWNIKVAGLNMLTEYMETYFPNYSKLKGHVHWETEDL